MNLLKKSIFFFMFTCTLIPWLYSQERLIKPGDVLEITVFSREELNKTVVVKQNGTIHYPGVQGVQVISMSIQRFQNILVSQLSRYMGETLLIAVRFAEQYPIRITVMGQVLNPGLHTILNTSSIQGAIMTAGGFAPSAQLTNIKLIRVENNKTSNRIINMEEFYIKGDPSDLPTLKDGDTIVVPGNPLATTIKVLGSVELPGSYEVSSSKSLLDIIYLAGGPTVNANLKKVRIGSVTRNNVLNVHINMKELVQSQNLQSIPVVVPGDIVYIPEKKVTWRKFINFIRDITAFAILYYFIRRSDQY